MEAEGVAETPDAREEDVNNRTVFSSKVIVPLQKVTRKEKMRIVKLSTTQLVCKPSSVQIDQFNACPITPSLNSTRA